MRDIDKDKRHAIIAFLMLHTNQVTGKVFRGGYKMVSEQFPEVSKRSMERFMADFRDQRNLQIRSPDLASKRKGACGRNSKLTDEVREHYVRIGQEYANAWIKLTGRILVEELATAGFPFSLRTVQVHLKQLHSREVNVRIKPLLSPEHKLARMKFILSQVDRNHGLVRAQHHWKDQLNTVHVDESWFYLQSADNKVLIFDGITVPDAPTVRHKSHITKVMFLVAVGRPQTRALERSSRGLAIWLS